MAVVSVSRPSLKAWRPFRRGFGRALAALARLLAQILARVAPGGRRVQQRHGRAAHRAQQERQQNIARSGAFVSCHSRLHSLPNRLN